MNLKENKERHIGRFKGSRWKGECCNYIIISKRKRKNITKKKKYFSFVFQTYESMCMRV